jgi:uncharacterized membrane protein YqjE
MTLSIGIFDLFTNAIPGFLQLAVFGYVATRLGWVDATVVTRGPTVLVLVGVAVVAYLIGHLLYPLAYLISRSVPGLRIDGEAPRRAFLRKLPGLAGRPFVRADRHVLHAAVELHDGEVAAEISRLRALGLMLRNASLPFASAALVAVVEVFTSGRPAFAAVAALALALAVAGCQWHGRTMLNWATVRTLEVSFWLPGVDDRLAAAEEPAPPGEDGR